MPSTSSTSISDRDGQAGVSAERRITGPVVSFDLPFETARIRAERAYTEEGHSARTLAKYPDLRVVLVAMKPNARMSLHETAERLTLQVILGQARLWLEGAANTDVGEGAFLAVDAALAHQIECLEECAFLLTLTWPPAEAERTKGGDSSADDFDPIDL
jgi:quercetin dioxygenase-like cupin family protein